MTPLLRILLEASIRVSLVAGAVGLVLMVARVGSSSLRHAAWAAVLCAMLLMPVLPYVVPTVGVPVQSPDIGPPSYVPESLPLPLPLESTQVEPLPASAPVPDGPPVRGPVWPAIVVVVYAAGVLSLLARLLMGWISVQRVLRASTRIAGLTGPVFVSPLLATPLTVGLIAPKVLFPSAWNEWPEEKLRAVLAHELAHVERRDTLTSLLAHLNRCLFWFHPLAWWLERKLALTAEQAADDAGVQAVGESRKYAEVLLDMAEAARRSGSRFAWHGVGVDGTGLLGQRIDRILQGGFLRGVSRTRKVVVALSCAAAIFLVAACRQTAKFEPLKEDPEYAAQWAMNKAAEEFSKAARGMTAEQVSETEAAVKRNPEDLESRKKLMIFYQTNGRKVLGDEKTITAFRAHKLWFIERHPEDELASFANPLSDPLGYEQERKLWIAVLARKDLSAQTLVGAAQLLEISDRPLAETILLRAQAAEPKWNWSMHFGRLYAAALTGPDHRGTYAQQIRRKLDESTDPKLLEAAGRSLVERSYPKENESKLDFDQAVLGRSLLEKALKLDPTLTVARVYTVAFRTRGRHPEFWRQAFRDPSGAYKTASAWPEAERFQTLASLALEAYSYGEFVESYNHDPAGAKTNWEQARTCAQDVLRLAPKFVDDPDYGTALHKAHMTLGMVAMRVDGDKRTAAKHLVEASKAPATEELAVVLPPMLYKLPVLLLKYGGPEEREAVIDYLERYGTVLKRQDVNLLEAAAQLRKGYMPIWYQYQAANLK